jgi:hypothetical protein
VGFCRRIRTEIDRIIASPTDADLTPAFFHSEFISRGTSRDRFSSSRIKTSRAMHHAETN